MALEFGNRVVVTTSTTGAVSAVLGGTLTDAFLTFAEAGISNNATVRYLITEGDDFELGTGTYSTTGPTLTRDTVIVSKIAGTAGTSKMNLGGNAVVRVTAAATDIPINPALLDQAGQTLNGGVEVTLLDHGTLTSGTLTLNMGQRPSQKVTCGGAFTLNPGSAEGSCLLDVVNNASAGNITIGFDKVTGAFDTVNGNRFRCHCSVVDGTSLLSIQAMQ